MQEKNIFETEVVEIGGEAALAIEEKMIILFGDNVPDLLADFCYQIKLQKTTRKIVPRQTLLINEDSFQITSVGDVVNQNLDKLGHITIKFDGSPQADLPGTLYVEAKKIPEIAVGSKISIQ